MYGFDREHHPFLIVLVLTVCALVVFWPVLDTVVLGASLAVVLMPVHRRFLHYTRPVISSAIITGCLFILCAGAAYGTLLILKVNAGIINQIVATIGSWLDNPATRPGAFGITISKETPTLWLCKRECALC